MAWRHEWVNSYPRSEYKDPRPCASGSDTYFSSDEPDRIAHYRLLSANFYFQYAMLIVNSFGLQNALERSAVDIGHFFARCHSSAVSCATILRDEIGPAGYLRYAPDTFCVMSSYAVLSLLKVSSGIITISSDLDC